MPTRGQIDARLREPLPVEEVPKLDIKFIDPSYSEAVVNLQMDYLLSRKALLNKRLFSSPLTLTLLIAWLGVVYRLRLQDYFSSFNFKDGFLQGMEILAKSPQFRSDIVESLAMIGLFVGIEWAILNRSTRYWKEQSQAVPDHQQEYFGIDMGEYASLTDKSKLSKEEKKQVEQMKQNSVNVVYRQTPIGFIVKKQQEDKTEDTLTYKITALGIRRVYISAGVLEDLLTYVIRDLHKVEGYKNVRCLFDIYSFENYEREIAEGLGFKLEAKERFNKDLLLARVFGVEKQTFVYEVTEN